MAAIRYMVRVGNRYQVHYDDGSSQFLLPSIGNRFLPDKGIAVTPDPEPVPVGDSGGGVIVSSQMVTSAVNALGGSTSNMVASASQIAAMFNDAASQSIPGVFSSKKRAACIIGECAQESAGFSTTREFGDQSGSAYYPYVGRGFIQVTWRDNYAAFGQWCYGKGIVADPNTFVNNPALLESTKYAALTAIWYFSTRSWTHTAGGVKNLFEFCDLSSSPWEDISRAINTGNPYSTFTLPSIGVRAAAIDAALAVTPDPTPKPASGHLWPLREGTYSIGAAWGETGSWATYHTGQDFPASLGTPLYAVADGTILPPAMTDYTGPYHTVLKIDSGETFSYWHCASRLVSVGARVKAGQKIATVGDEGRSFGPHLHFEYYPAGVSYTAIYQSVDPMTWLKDATKW